MISLIRSFQLSWFFLKKNGCQTVHFHLGSCGVLTDDAEDTQDVGREYHQHVDHEEQEESDDDVTQPVEGFGGEQHLLDGSPHLQAHTGPTGARCQYPFSSGVTPNEASAHSRGRARWGRSAWRRWGRPRARTGSTYHTGRSGCRCAAAQAPLYLDE